MVSELTAEMIQIMFRAVMKHMNEMPANEVTGRLLHQYTQILQWLQARAQKIDNRPETTEMIARSIRRVSKMIDQVEEQKLVKFVMRSSDQVEPFDLVKLLAAWDSSFSGGSVAVLERLEEAISQHENKITLCKAANEERT